MDRTDTFIAATPERVFEVLADAHCYAEWVVGAQEIRDADEEFPAPGSRFHHRVGIGPLAVPDHTEVLDVNEPYRLELRARVRPLLTARVTLLLEPREGGTCVTMIEEGADPLSRLLLNPLTRPLTHQRNVQSLRRLKALAERRAAIGAHARQRTRDGAREALRRWRSPGRS